MRTSIKFRLISVAIFLAWSAWLTFPESVWAETGLAGGVRKAVGSIKGTGQTASYAQEGDPEAQELAALIRKLEGIGGRGSNSNGLGKRDGEKDDDSLSIHRPGADRDTSKADRERAYKRNVSHVNGGLGMAGGVGGANWGGGMMGGVGGMGGHAKKPAHHKPAPSGHNGHGTGGLGMVGGGMMIGGVGGRAPGHGGFGVMGGAGGLRPGVGMGGMGGAMMGGHR